MLQPQPGGTAKTRSRRTKQLHWDKIRMKNTDGTVWSRESADLGDGFNREELENLFQVLFVFYLHSCTWGIRLMMIAVFMYMHKQWYMC